MNAPPDALAPRLEPNPLRWAVVDRVALAGHRHAGHLHDLHGTAALPARHAVVFLFHQPTTGLDNGIRIATRMFLDGDDADDLILVLHELGNRFDDYRRTRRTTHPLALMIDRAEVMTPEARYLGTATSSLAVINDTPASVTARDWLGLAKLVDGTQLILRDRLTPSDVTDTRGLDVTTTHTLDRDGPFDSFTSRAWGYPLPNTPDDELADMLDALERLHTFVAETERRRRRRATRN